MVAFTISLKNVRWTLPCASFVPTIHPLLWIDKNKQKLSSSLFPKRRGALHPGEREENA